MLMGPYYEEKAVVRAQKNSDSLCGVFNPDRSQFKSRPLHKMKPPLSEHVYIEIVHTTKFHMPFNIHR